MSSNDNYGYGEQPENPTRMEIIERERKKREQTGSWRDNTTPIWSPDSVFKMIRDNSIQHKQKLQNEEIADIINHGLPAELEPITYSKAVEMNLSAEEWKRQDTIPAMKPNQYIDARRSQH